VCPRSQALQVVSFHFDRQPKAAVSTWSFYLHMTVLKEERIGVVYGGGFVKSSGD